MNRSDLHYQKARELIPWGTQTNSKRPYPFFDETMPKYIDRGKGCRLWDLDGREYIDFRMALGPIILGYCYDEVDDAVRAQMRKGVLFSMASPVELELAEAVHGMVPNADMVRFVKNGADANMFAVRLARAYTGRDLILTAGYHGYHDWFATEGSPGNGVPSTLREHVQVLTWGDIREAEDLVGRYRDRIACVITIPYDLNEDVSGAYVARLRELTKQYGILLIFDEVLTGFRLAPGGAQEYYGVDADLGCYAKAIANGYPVAAVAGKRKYMEKMAELRITTTYGGEALSIAAAARTLAILKRDRVVEHIWAMGKRLMGGFNAMVREVGVSGHAGGLPPASFLKFDGPDPAFHARLEFLWHRELYREGVFASPRWFLSYSHKEQHIDEALARAKRALQRALAAEPRERDSVRPYWW